MGLSAFDCALKPRRLTELCDDCGVEEFEERAIGGGARHTTEYVYVCLKCGTTYRKVRTTVLVKLDRGK